MDACAIGGILCVRTSWRQSSSGKIRQDSLKSAMSIQDKPAETQTEAKTDKEPTALIAKRD
ncbi:hypothetical protein [Haemophilus haemolyticus]|uniref:hypothetical protein n=1 Tax=Haemophilus haemolyticus TaxID=726 RepID=UPI001EFDABE1|nr:hypothetical protein [Haemophilus haemolyticus]